MKKFLEKIESLDNIHQWAEADSVVKESVSQHSFKVSAIANYLLKFIRQAITEHIHFLDFSNKVLSYAIMHDFDEAIFGRDVSHIVKYNKFNGENIRKSIDEYVDHILETDFPGLLPKPEYAVKRFVKLCDWIALLTFVNRNQNMGAKTFSHESEYCHSMIIETMREVEELLMSEFKIKIELNELIKLEEL